MLLLGVGSQGRGVTEAAKTTMKQLDSSQVLRFLAALLCPSSEMFSICDAKFFYSSGLYDYTSLSDFVSKPSFQIAGYI